MGPTPEKSIKNEILWFEKLGVTRTGLSEVFNYKEFDMLSGFRFGSQAPGNTDFWYRITSGLSLGVWFWDSGCLVLGF